MVGNPTFTTPSRATESPMSRDSSDPTSAMTARCMFSDNVCHFGLSLTRNLPTTGSCDKLTPWYGATIVRDEFFERLLNENSCHRWWRTRACAGVEACAIRAWKKFGVRRATAGSRAKRNAFPSISATCELRPLAAKLGADLTVVGPEIPLVRGITDEFRARTYLIGAFKGGCAARGQQDFCEEVYGAARHSYRRGVRNYEQAVEVYTDLYSVDWPLVIKADGLAAGKGVL